MERILEDSETGDQPLEEPGFYKHFARFVTVVIAVKMILLLMLCAEAVLKWIRSEHA